MTHDTPATNWSEDLARLGACREARAFVMEHPTLAAAWTACARGDWMLWLLGRATTSEPWSDERKPLVLCALDCATRRRA